MKIVVTISGDQVIINDPATDYHHDTLTEWIDQAKRALGGDGEMHLTTDTELAAVDDTVDEPDDHIGFRP